MKKFVFRFEVVERHRNLLLDDRTAALAEALRKRRVAEDLLAQRRAALATLQAAGPAAGEPFDARRELIRQRYLFTLRAEIARREQQLALIDEEIAEARAAVAEAHRAVRAMELLRARDEAAWRAELRRHEDKQTDEHNGRRRP